MATTQGIKLDENTQKRLKALGKQRDRSAHWLMKRAIDQYLEREEKYEREKSEDMERWDHYLKTGEAIDNSVAKEWLQDLSRGERRSWRDYL